MSSVLNFPFPHLWQQEPLVTQRWILTGRIHLINCHRASSVSATSYRRNAISYLFKNNAGILNDVHSTLGIYTIQMLGLVAFGSVPARFLRGCFIVAKCNVK